MANIEWENIYPSVMSMLSAIVIGCTLLKTCSFERLLICSDSIGTYVAKGQMITFSIFKCIHLKAYRFVSQDAKK